MRLTICVLSSAGVSSQQGQLNIMQRLFASPALFGSPTRFAVTPPLQVPTQAAALAGPPPPQVPLRSPREGPASGKRNAGQAPSAFFALDHESLSSSDVDLDPGPQPTHPQHKPAAVPAPAPGPPKPMGRTATVPFPAPSPSNPTGPGLGVHPEDTGDSSPLPAQSAIGFNPVQPPAIEEGT